MLAKIHGLLEEVNEQLTFLNLEEDDIIIRCEKAVFVMIKAIDQVKNLVISRGFRTEQEEISFFKELKPQFSSRLIYYNSIYKIETKKTSGGTRIVRKYYNRELEKLKSYFDNNLDFYRYYRTGSTYQDHKYFVRGVFDVKLSLDNYYFETDIQFSTSHDFKVAKIIANDLLQVYIENQLLNLENREETVKPQRIPNADLIWTGSKSSLTELGYALQSEGVFNNGAADLKTVMEYLQQVFNVELGQYRRTFLEIRSRRGERARFLAALREKLIKRMDDTDESGF